MRPVFGLHLVDAVIVLLAAPEAVQASQSSQAPAQTCTVLAENFDGVTAPALPPGWVATNVVVGTPVWATSTITPDTPPNDAFVDDPAVVADKRLDTPDIFITSTSAQVLFRNGFNLENTFDGGVLEVSALIINNGQFTDITDPAVGGSFVNGGYTATISTAFQSPISGRQAWSGNSNGYINTVANLGPRVAGQTIKLRFRMGSDTSVSAVGWRVDTIVVTDVCAAPSPSPTCVPLIQGFDDIATLIPSGWFIQNNSQPGPGSASWFQGNSTVFPAHSGAGTSYIGVNFNSGTATSTLSNWLLTPTMSLPNGTQLSFFTRTVDAPQFPDRLQVRMSRAGASTNVGVTANDVGDFTTLLLDINPNYSAAGYPNVWTQFTAIINDPGPPITGRLAFRYFVENGGPTGTNSDYIGIDTLQVVGGCVVGATPTPTPTTTASATATAAATSTPTATAAATPSPPVIISPVMASCLVGQQFTYQFEATGADSLGVTNMPLGLSFDENLAAITGIPDTAGMSDVTLIARNLTTGLKFIATLSLNVQPTPAAGPMIVSGTAATGRVGQPFTFHVITINGSPAARLSTANLPAGLSADAVTGVISGTPTAAGSSAVTLTVTDGSLTTNALLQLTFISDPARPVILSRDTALLTIGQPFSYTIRAPSDGDPTMFTLFGNLPNGLVFDSVAGTITGTPQPGGSERSGTPDLTGGTLLGSVQLFGTNSNGSGTFQLLFLVAPSGLVNISTRMQVGTEASVLIGGVIITGNAPKVVIVRAIGPSLAGAGIPGALQDPTLELHDPAHPQTVVFNDNWKDSQEQIIRDTGIAPTDDRESAIVAGLDPGNYTAIVSGKANTTGVGLVEVYDLGTASLSASSTARLSQISTRGTVLTGNDVMIGGFIINGGTTRVLLRAIGPSLSAFGVPNALQDTVLELHDGSGSLLTSNDNWRDTQQKEIIATGIPPTDDRESAIIANLSPGNYTGIVNGKNNTTGVALVEVYALE